MPMEFAQYAVTRPENDAGTDGAILVRHDRAMMLTLPADRVVASVFSQSFPNLLESAIEMPISRVLSPGRILAAEYNDQGDRIGTTLITAKRAMLRIGPAPQFQPVYGAVLIRNFVRMERSRGVIVIGGLPTGFLVPPMEVRAADAVRDFYQENGALFAALPNLSRYPVADFYDSPDHLAQPCQFKHSVAVAWMLGSVLHRPVAPPMAAVTALAATCPN
jgi:hypothetical protein